MAEPSYIVSGQRPDIIYTDIISLLEKFSNEYPEFPANIFRMLEDAEKKTLTRTVVTYRDLCVRSLAVAGHLLNIGLQPGDTVAMAGPNCPEWLYFDYACLRLQVILIRVPMMFLNKEALVRLLDKYSCKLLVISEDIIDKLDDLVPSFIDKSLPQEMQDKLRTLQDIILMTPDVQSSTTTKLKMIAELISYSGDTSAVKDIQSRIDPEKPLVVMPTSGSTGESKFAFYSHFKLINGWRNNFGMMIPEEGVLFTDRPFGWIGGCAFAPLIFEKAISMVYLDTAVTMSGCDFDLVSQVLAEEEVTTAVLLAYMLFDAMKAKEVGTALTPTLQYVLTGGERTPQDLIDFARSTFKVMLMIYGSTECMFAGRGSISADPSLDTGSLSNMQLSPCYETKIVDEDERVKPRGEPGRLLVRSLFTMQNYFRDAVATSAVKTETGWVDSGDIGIITGQGLLQIIGRTKEIISRGSSKIYPKVIEDILIEHPAVEKILAVGVSDPRLFEEVCACVVRKDESLTEDELRKFYSTKVLQDSYMPRYYVFVKEFPKGGTGKFDRKALVVQAQQLLGINTN